LGETNRPETAPTERQFAIHSYPGENTACHIGQEIRGNKGKCELDLYGVFQGKKLVRKFKKAENQ
jgi:hypothetical protein